jgi:Uma2 family endonuclease
MSAQPEKYYTAEEYLALEEVATYKSEYYKGRIYPMGDYDDEAQRPEMMAGARPPHNSIRENMSIEVGTHLKKDKNCRSYSSDQRVYIPSTDWYCYPDLVVACGQSEFNESDSLLNPVLIVEVLSKSTASYDRSEKFELYRDIPTFAEYFLIDSRRIWAELWRKVNGVWSLVFEAKALESTVYFESIGLSLSMNDLYLNTEEFISGDFQIR